MNINKELVGASTSILILSVIAQSPTYGYHIVKRINKAADGVIAWKEGTVYPVLHKLEKSGYIKSEWLISENGRRRKYYSITGQGKDAIRDCSRQWDYFHGLVRRLAEVQYA